MGNLGCTDVERRDGALLNAEGANNSGGSSGPAKEFNAEQKLKMQELFTFLSGESGKTSIEKLLLSFQGGHL